MIIISLLSIFPDVAYVYISIYRPYIFYFVNTGEKIINTLFSTLNVPLGDVVFISEHIGLILFDGCVIFYSGFPTDGQDLVNTNDVAVNVLLHGTAGTWASTSVRNSSAFFSKRYQSSVLVSTRLPRRGPPWLPPLSLHSLNTYNMPTDILKGHQWPPSLVHHLWLFCRIWPYFLSFPEALLAWLIGGVIFVLTYLSSCFSCVLSCLPKVTIWQEREGVGPAGPALSAPGCPTQGVTPTRWPHCLDPRGM